jgi:hypothetical protein
MRLTRGGFDIFDNFLSENVGRQDCRLLWAYVTEPENIEDHLVASEKTSLSPLIFQN